jgi:hypothetical protein
MTILIALWSNLHVLAFVAALIASIASLVLGVVWAMEADMARSFGGKKEVANAATYRRLFKKAAIATAIFAALTAIPDVNDLWRARIALVKLELASTENVQKGTEEIARIARRLECKYLGCKEEKEKEK